MFLIRVYFFCFKIPTSVSEMSPIKTPMNSINTTSNQQSPVPVPVSSVQYNQNAHHNHQQHQQHAHHKPTTTKTPIKSHYSQNQHQQIRNFINSSSYLSRQINNSSHLNTTVRINPLLLKRKDATPPAQIPSEASKKIHSNSNSYNLNSNISHISGSSNSVYLKNPVIHHQEMELLHHNHHQQQQQHQHHIQQQLNQQQHNMDQNTMLNNFLLTSQDNLNSSSDYSTQINNVNDLISNQFV